MGVIYKQAFLVLAGVATTVSLATVGAVLALTSFRFITTSSTSGHFIFYTKIFFTPVVIIDFGYALLVGYF